MGIILLSCGVAFGTTIIDQTDNVVGGYYEADTLYFNYDSGSGQYIVEDTIGTGFDTSKVEINNSGNDIAISIFTEFDGYELIGSVGVELADFFISDSSGVYAVDLSWDEINSYVYSDGFFYLGTEELYITSQDIFIGNDNKEFGAAYDDDGAWQLINVDFDQDAADFLSTITVSSVFDSSSSSWIYSFVIDNTDGYVSDTYSIFFGTGECGNDVITGTIPEPTTMVLFGFGLLSFSALGRRKNNI